MPRPFALLDHAAFEDLLRRYPVERRISNVHLHHTWRPRKSDFAGESTIDAMWRYHTRDLGWSDIAQHLTIDPAGGIWTGRDWNRSPASASGFNGTSVHGPFMIEMIGDFDLGEELLEDAQRDSVLQVLALLHLRFQLDPCALGLHRQMSGKTCPGTGIDREPLIAEVEERMEVLSQRSDDTADEPGAALFAADMLESSAETERLIAHLTGGAGRRGAEVVDEGELPESDMGLDALQGLLAPETGDGPARGGDRGRRELTPEVLDPLKAHVVNLRQGRFSKGGIFETGSGDVERIFSHHLPRWREAHPNDPLRLLFYAHGGLVSEGSALRAVHRYVSWWKENGVYPVFFVWETGILEIVGQLLKQAWDRIRGAGRRDLFDFTTDPLVEVVARGLGGELIWGGMKRSAERASDTDGGANEVALKLRAFVRDQGDGDGDGGGVQVHCVGHSAGAIFLRHFIPKVVAGNGPAVDSLHFLAPALRIDEFRETLAPQIGKKIDRFTLYAMKKGVERDDKASPVYRKSLLYLVSHALETERNVPLLGLQASVRRDDEVQDLLSGDDADALYSPTGRADGRNATLATTHGGFDDDGPTMESVLRRMLDLGDGDPIAPFPAEREGARAVGGEDAVYELLGGDEELELALDLLRAGGGGQLPTGPSAPARPAPQTPAGPAPGDGGGDGDGGGRTAATGGARRALCVGIDDYPTAPLAGCVNDARTWGTTLSGLGFEVSYLIDGQATEATLLERLRRMITSSRPGDVLVFQYAGHGTELPDFDGDEIGRDTDQALVPADYQDGATVVDDELGKVYDLLPAGVNLTLFMDCCHSGANNRLLLSGLGETGMRGGEPTARFMAPNATMLESQRRRAAARGLAAKRQPGAGREVLFAACEPFQSALEQDGQGLFTGHAAPLLADAVAGGWSHTRLLERIRGAFGPQPPQLPRLDGRREGVVLRPVGGAPATTAASGGADTATLDLVARRLEELVSLLRRPER